jgi:hypothetical protein
MEILVYLGLLFWIAYLIITSNITQEKYKVKSAKMKDEINEMKSKTYLIQEKNKANHFMSIDFYKILGQVSDLHQLIISKYLK